MDAKQAVAFITRLPGSFDDDDRGTVRDERAHVAIIKLIESLAAKAELVDEACKTIDNLDCQGKFSEADCNEDVIECACVDFCRLRAGMKER